MPIHTAELALHCRNYVTAGRVDREADSRSSGVTHRNQHQQCLEPHFELKLNEQFKSVVVYLIGASFYP
jgi:hypothetical protein